MALKEKPAVAKVSSGKRIRVPDELAEEVGINDGDYVVIGKNPRGNGLIISPLSVSLG